MTTTAQENGDDVLATAGDALRAQALDRLKKRRDLNAHLLVYTLVNSAIWGIWAVIAVTSGSSWPWPVFLTLFWGIGVAMNVWDVYFRRPITEQELEREIDRLLGHGRGRARCWRGRCFCACSSLNAVLAGGIS